MKHYQNILEIPSDELATLMVKVQELAKLITAKLNANGVNILVNTNEAAGQTVMHLHIHIIPRYDENDGISIDFKPNENANLSDVLNDINK